MRFPEARALEDTAHRHGLVPTRIFGLLLPIWSVEIRATVTEGEPFELIDRFLERGIAHAGLRTAEELASFFALDLVLVDRALRFLHATGHVVFSTDARVSLTELGERSVRDDKRYVVSREDRRRLYFDAFRSTPLTRKYYDPDRGALLEGEALQEALDSEKHFTPLFCSTGFRQSALTELSNREDRERFNLPERIDDPQSLGEHHVYMPVYLVRAVSRKGSPRYLVYTNATDGKADPELSELYTQTPEVHALVENEEHAARSDPEKPPVRKWLERHGLSGCEPRQRDNGTWYVTLPASSFENGGTVSLNQLSSFVVQGNSFFRIWCTDERVRCLALLERISHHFGRRPRIPRSDFDARLSELATQLGLRTPDLSALRHMAYTAGREDVIDQLQRVDMSTPDQA